MSAPEYKATDGNIVYTQNKEEISQLEKTRDRYKKHLKIVQKNAAQHRDNDLDRLARKRATEWNIKASQAIVVIKAAEESKKLHTKQRAFLKPKREGGIRKIMVPTPITNIQPKSTHVTNEKIQCTIYGPKEIFNVLLRQNFRHLQKSQDSIFTTGKLAEEMGDDMEIEIVDQILIGVDISQDIITAHSEYDYTFEHFIKSMQRATDLTGKEVRDYK